jgi:hypothetical protein
MCVLWIVVVIGLLMAALHWIALVAYIAVIVALCVFGAVSGEKVPPPPKAGMLERLWDWLKEDSGRRGNPNISCGRKRRSYRR